MVEDNPADVGLIRQALKEHGVSCELTIATDGQQAIELIDAIDQGHDSCPDMIILDLRLPKRNGFQVLQRIRASLRCAAARVVILTSSDAPEDKSTVAKLGANAYLCKPDDLDEFMKLGAVLKNILAGGIAPGFRGQ